MKILIKSLLFPFFLSFLCLFLSPSAFAQRSVKGKVTDDSGQPLKSVTVTEKGRNNSTVTNDEGDFSIGVSNSDAVLVFTSVSLLPKEVRVNNESVLTVAMQTDQKILGDVVVVGYGTQRKKGSYRCCCLSWI
jgi:hypothetical protein